MSPSAKATIAVVILSAVLSGQIARQMPRTDIEVVSDSSRAPSTTEGAPPGVESRWKTVENAVGSEPDSLVIAGGASLSADDASATRVETSSDIWRTGTYSIQSTWYDNKHTSIALRQGTSTWGWAHVQKHNVSRAMNWKATKFPRSRSVSGSTITYQTPALKLTCWLGYCWVDKSMEVRVVVNTTRLTDGFLKGVIMAYCVGVSVCPAWVRQVAE